MLLAFVPYSKHVGCGKYSTSIDDIVRYHDLSDLLALGLYVFLDLLGMIIICYLSLAFNICFSV